MLERAKDTQKQINDLDKKLESMLLKVNKLNEYYDHNNLKHNSVQQIATLVSQFEKQLEGKANSLDFKKLVPRIRKNNNINIYIIVDELSD